MDSDLFTLLFLLNIKGLGYKKALALMENWAEAEEILKLCPERDPILKRVENEAQMAKKLHIQMISFKNPFHEIIYDLDETRFGTR